LLASLIDPVQVEIAAGFRLSRGLELTPAFGLTMGKAIVFCAQFVLPFRGSLTRESKIDQFSHDAPLTVSKYIPLAHQQGCIWHMVDRIMLLPPVGYR
jgi:hypothetical protein